MMTEFVSLLVCRKLRLTSDALQADGRLCCLNSDINDGERSCSATAEHLLSEPPNSDSDRTSNRVIEDGKLCQHPGEYRCQVAVTEEYDLFGNAECAVTTRDRNGMQARAVATCSASVEGSAVSTHTLRRDQQRKFRLALGCPLGKSALRCFCKGTEPSGPSSLSR